ncbi:preprotein translocase subunit SecA [Candidatus Erwinia haradaeae]|uniref:Protein translocase subunit SecA n=1 Tax=Candidatus Erwinia haradaeae TaxID=1922217 RepID=A0A451D2H9_9GAMM|nr:preprotein translocase subunit SecA [Candidatus Erwinia haradaeae]VFP79852.1 Protein translocase subunit SecA [Candidatus Erwinia haradaeae]
MFIKLLKKFFGSSNDRTLQRMYKIVNRINTIESNFIKLTDHELRAKTTEFRTRIQQGETLNNLIPEAFATVREASKRVCGLRHFDVQLLGGIVLNNRCIAEMQTGEGKTLTATLPAYLNALSGKGVHIVTVNDYLAKRDAENNRSTFEFLNLTVGINLPGMSVTSKSSAYAADITYGTNHEYGFDYLRDNMVFSAEERVQRKLHYALIDEVDSILIDEARTPLIISGPTENNSNLYIKINKIIPQLSRQEKEDSETFQGQGHFSVDEKTRQVHLTERGLTMLEQLMVSEGILSEGESLYSQKNIIIMHYIIAALRAHTLFIPNIDYIVKNNEILIIDEHTGRSMPGRRWSDGIHQAIEAKEGVVIQNENQTLASITFQNYFRLYNKLAGMTGTADTEALEFRSIYNLDTIVVPTNRPMIRQDLPDLVYVTEKEKITAIINDIRDCQIKGQPVLVGSISIEKSEMISQALTCASIKHTVLNAKFHAHEAAIIAQAGQTGSVTIATNMAGRGTDIVLGGKLQTPINVQEKEQIQQIKDIKMAWQKCHNLVLESGGLHIIGTERHESRRIDNQLRGRAGRQGDPGSSRFYLSMEDSLMRIFTSDRVMNMMRKLGMKKNEAIQHPWVTQAIANAQRKIESRNFDIRKQLLEYDDVANDQRCAMYSQRNQLLDASDISNILFDMQKDVYKTIVHKYIPIQSISDLWEITDLQEELNENFKLDIPIATWLEKERDIDEQTLLKRIIDTAKCQYQHKRELFNYDMICSLEKNVMLQTLDALWKEHLAAMDYLRQGIHLRGYAQKDPKQEYKRESFMMFSAMLESLKYEVIKTLQQIETSHVSQKSNTQQKTMEMQEVYFVKQEQKLFQKMYSHTEIIKSTYIDNNEYEIRRNNSCPCGSGKKYKKCCGGTVEQGKQFL